MRAHEWIEVLNRRWCIGCATHQTRRRDTEHWPKQTAPCLRDTARAQYDDDIAQRVADLNEWLSKRRA